MLTCYLLGRNVVHAIAWNGSYLEWTLDSIFTTKKKKKRRGRRLLLTLLVDICGKNRDWKNTVICF